MPRRCSASRIDEKIKDYPYLSKIETYGRMSIPCRKNLFEWLHIISSTGAGMTLPQKKTDMYTILSVQVQYVKEMVENIFNDVMVAHIDYDSKGNSHVGGYIFQETKDRMKMRKKTVSTSVRYGPTV